MANSLVIVKLGLTIDSFKIEVNKLKIPLESMVLKIRHGTSLSRMNWWPRLDIDETKTGLSFDSR